MPKRIGILQTGHVPDALKAAHGDFADMFRRLLAGPDLVFDVIEAADGAPLGRPTDRDGWLITGSPHGAYEGHPWIAPLESFIRAAMRARRPMVGICFGHQIMAQALGGRVAKHPGGWGLGMTDYATDGGSGLPDRIVLNAAHQDQVTVPPPEARVIARNDFCPYAGLAYGDSGLSLQPHPEFEAAFMADLLAARRGGAFPAADVDRALPTLSRTGDAGAVAAALRRFLTADR